MKTYPFLSPPKKKKKVGGEGRPFRGASVLGGAVGVRGQVPGPAFPAPLKPGGLGGAGWVGLDVQRGLLAREEPEHGGRHGLHVDLSTRDRG